MANRCKSTDENGMQCCWGELYKDHPHRYVSNEDLTCKLCKEVCEPWDQQLMWPPGQKPLHSECVFAEVDEGRATTEPLH